MSAAVQEQVVWHDVECGGYLADLPLWRELARERPGPVLELGCGTGRVAIDLARAGHTVTAIDADAELVAALRSRAQELGLDVAAHVADARRTALPGEFGLIAAPMQMIQLLAGPADRLQLLESACGLLAPGGCVAVAIVEGVPGGGGDAHALPDVAEMDGWVYSSLPLDIVARDGWMEVTRLRQIVAPDGALTEAVDETRLAVLSEAQLEAEAEQAGLRPAGRVEVATTEDHVGSTVVLLEAER